MDALLPPEMAERAEEAGVAIFVATLDPDFVTTQGLLPQAQALTWMAFLGRNLLPVTIGNIIGGSILVGAVYWFVYLRARGPGS